MKALVMVGMILGSTAGSYVPVLWNGELLSMSSVLFGALGGLLGIWIGFEIARRFDL
jgi:hypothetical protein